MFYELVVVVLLLFLILNIKNFTKQWCNPAYIMVVYWTINIIVALCVLSDSYQWHISGLIWIIIACAIFATSVGLGVIIAERTMRYRTINEGEKQLSLKSWKFIWMCLIIGLIHFGLEVVINGFSFQMFLNLDTLLEMNSAMAYSRYNGDGAYYGIVMQLMLIFIYSLPLIGGYAFVYSSKRRERALCVSSFIPIICSLLLTNGKAGVIASVMLWFSGYMTGYLEKYKKAPIIKGTNFFRIVLVGLLVLSLLYISMMLRIGTMDLETMAIVNEKYVSYAIGHVSAFDYWFDKYADTVDYAYGKYTFYGIVQALGISEREQGVYSEMIYAGDMSTNVYTVFRGIITDFGIYGGTIFFILFGFIAGYAYKYVLYKSNCNNFFKVVLAGTYFFIAHSALSSALTYTSYILALCLFGIYLHLAKEKLNGRN